MKVGASQPRLDHRPSSSLQTVRQPVSPTRSRVSPFFPPRCRLRCRQNLLISLAFPFLHMARGRPGRSPRQQGQRPRCPLCGGHFTDILRHLNHRQSKCANWFNAVAPPRTLPPHHNEHATEDAAPIQHHFSNAQQPPPPPLDRLRPHHIKFSGAAKTYGQSTTFMDRFHNDRYSEFRTSNVHYPFSGRDEWELASFLLSSGLSMNKVNEFLRLKVVCNPPHTWLISFY